MRKNKLDKGITLIALIITIIILLILAVVTIGSIKNSNIIANAQNAATDYNVEKEKEESTISGYESLIESNIPGETGDSNSKVPVSTISEAQLDTMLTKTVNSEIYDAYKNKIVVPAGFKILVDTTTGYSADDINVTKGIVIQDLEGNEFVWIPVGENITNGTKTETISLSRYTFKKDTGEKTIYEGAAISERDQELSSSDLGNETAKNLSEFLSSANANNGYYIARYEAGVAGYDSSNVTTSNSNKDTNWTGYIAEEGKELKLLSKYGQQVWNYVTQNKASELCQNMYVENSNYTSDLVNSYAWETAIVFIQTFGTELNASIYSTLNKSKSFENTGSIVNNDKYCNIYDMSGNASEWSTGTYKVSAAPCVECGGCYIASEGKAVVDTRARSNRTTTSCSNFVSFRPLLYLHD